MEQIKKIIRSFAGVVVSDKMDKTRVIVVKSSKKHPKYRKIYISSKKFIVDDPKNQYHIGDKVKFVECRPISRHKRWRVVYDKV